jgi:rhodanese-related sulfurtransferase
VSERIRISSQCRLAAPSSFFFGSFFIFHSKNIMFVKNIDSNELAQWLKTETPPRLIDVRTTSEMAQASIPGGIPLPLNTLPVRLHEIPKDEQVVFYCRTGARSAQACMYLAQQGYDNIYNLHGGIVNWARNGLPIEPMLFN